MLKMLVVCAAVLLLAVSPLLAQAEPMVYAILFYSPTCPHCHDVINNHLPGIAERFGNQLELIFIDITTQDGQALAQSAYAYYEIPRDRWVVPMMLIGDQILIGSVQIPAEMPGLIETGLASGGVDLPAFPGMHEAHSHFMAQQADAETPAQAADTLANGLAIVVLITLVLSLAAVLRPLPERLVRAAQWAALALSLILAGTLVIQNTNDALATPLAWGSLIVLLAAGVLFFRRTDVVPLVATAGLAVAAYLAYVELTQTEAVCGAVGNCNAVQQSAYAQIMGVPIGVIGLAGYAAVLVVWLLGRQIPTLRGVLSGMVLAGTLFSVYLTFLEPFVIGAVCAWCLLSAGLMLTLLWLLAPRGGERLATWLSEGS